MDNTFGTLFREIKKHTVNKGQLLITPNENPRGVYYIHSGYIKMYDINANGEYQILAIHGPGDFFPIQWSLDDDDQQLFYETMGRAIISVMPKNDFKEAIYSSNEALRAGLAYLLKAFRISQLRIRNLEYLTTQERLAFRLIFLASYFGHQTDGGITIDVPIVYQDLANSVNSTRDTVNRVMSQFIADGIVTRSNRTLILRDITYLEEVVGISAPLKN